MTHKPAIDPVESKGLAALREILLTQDRVQLEALQRELAALRAQSESPEHLEALLDPMISDVLAERTRTHPQEVAEAIRPAIMVGIRRQVEEEQDVLIRVLTPIIGQTIQRSVAEAIESLARRVDARMERMLDFRSIWWRWQARLRGVEDAELVLREALPWYPEHVFLIHNQTGLVIAQATSGDILEDSDLIAALLTAIRDFSRESFQGEPGDTLHQIQFGERQILLEEGVDAYVALVGEGVPPADIYQHIREILASIHKDHRTLVQDFKGDVGAESVLAPALTPLLRSETPAPTKPPIAGVVVLLLALLLMCSACGWLGYSASPRIMAHLAPTAVMYMTQPTPSETPTVTLTPTSTPSPTPSPTPIPTDTPVATPSPTDTATPTVRPSPTSTATPTPRPRLGIMIGNVYARNLPDPASPHTGKVVFLGDIVHILERRDPWIRIAFPATGEPEITGWIPSRWVRVQQ